MIRAVGRRLLYLIIGVFGLASIMAPLRAQAFVTLKHSGDDTKWTQDIAWKVHPSGSDDVPIAELYEALSSAFDAWASVTCADLSFAYEGTSKKTQNGTIHISFDENNWDPSVGDAAAYTVSEKYWGSGNIKRASIVFNGVDQIWTTVESASSYGAKTDIQGVATHEIGHALGLDHPYEREATMFFSGGSSELRSLEPDDQRGVCFLYPFSSFKAGEACDSCSDHDNCKAGMCLTYPWEQNAAFCGADCSSATDCPPNFKCVNVEGVGGQCAPEHEYCSPSGGNIPLGEYCWGPSMCSSGLCVPVPGDAFCSKECSVGSSSSCPSGFQCFESSGGGGVCIKEGSKGFGQECTSPFECQSNLCYLGVCSQSCVDESSCPEGAACTYGFCIPPGTVYYGDFCTKHTECSTGFCTGLPSNFCSSPCKVTPDCPPGASCTPSKYCSKVTYSNDGGSCEADENCKEGLVCLYTSAFGSGTCRVPCDPVDDAGCGEGRGCLWVYDLNEEETRGGCVSDKGGGWEGAVCGPGHPVCSPHLICVDLPDPEAGYCARDCVLSSGAGCPAGDCAPLANAADPEQGVCLVDPTAVPGGDVQESDAGVQSSGSDATSSGGVGMQDNGVQLDAKGSGGLGIDSSVSQRGGDAVVFMPGNFEAPERAGSSGGCAIGVKSPSHFWVVFLALIFVIRRKRSFLLRTISS